MSIVTPKICSMAATDKIAIMKLSQRESTRGLLSHFMNSPSDCFVSQSDERASCDGPFERDTVEAAMSNTSVFREECEGFYSRRETSGKNGEFWCPHNPHNPSFCKLFRPAGGPFFGSFHYHYDIPVLSFACRTEMFFIQLFGSFSEPFTP